jgi:hypothetical protein
VKGWGFLKKRGQFEDLGVDGRIIDLTERTGKLGTGRLL